MYIQDGLIDEVRETDWVSGVNSLIGYVETNKTGDWLPYITAKEWQRNNVFDSMGCVSYSAVHCVEMILNYLITSKQIYLEHLNFLAREGYLNFNGLVNLSERFTAKMSGTTSYGNTCGNVWDSIRKQGVVPQQDWADWANPNFDWNGYYAEIPQSVKDKGLRFLKMFNINYEWVITNNSNVGVDLNEHLKQSPLQIGSLAWPTPINGVYPAIGCGGGHATAIVKQENGYFDFDHYEPFIKKLDPKYCFIWALKGVVTMISNKLDYDYEIVNSGDYIELKPGEEGELSLVLRNIGTETWKPYKVNLGIPNDKPSRLYNEKWLDCPRPCTVPHEVEPGGSVMFTIPVTLPLNAKAGEKFKLEIQPLAENLKWMKSLGIFYFITTK